MSFIPFSRVDELRNITYPAGEVMRAIPLPTVTQHNCPVPLFNSTESVKALINYIGQPLTVNSEDELHVLWTLTGLISPFYDQMDTLSKWAVANNVEEKVANQYMTSCMMRN